MQTIKSQIQVLYRYDTYNGDGYYWRTGPNGPWRGPFESYREAEQYANAVWGA